MGCAVRDYAMDAWRVDTHGHIDGIIEDLREAAQGRSKPVLFWDLTAGRHMAAGCRRLYGIDPGLYIEPDSPEEVFLQAEKLRRMPPSNLFEYALDFAHIRHMLAFTDHAPEKSSIRSFSSRLSFLAYIDAALLGDAMAFCPDFDDAGFNYYDALCGLFGGLGDIGEYLSAIDGAVDSWRANGVVGMKTAIAYTIGLHIGDPSYEEAKQAFARRQQMSPGDIRTVQHYAFRHALLACRRNAFPVVIHTGFTVWGHAPLSQTNPDLLSNLLADRRYKDIAFVLLHGGFPYIGQTTWLAGVFPNVYIDFTGISFLSRPRFRFALAEWLEMVPHTRMCLGSDCGTTPEKVVGIDYINRSEIAHVLEDMLQQGMMSERVALSFLENVYVNTPKRLFGV